MTASPLPPVFGGALVQDINVIRCVRALLPDRAVTWSEAHSIAERQATLLLQLVHVTEPPVPQFVICNLPGVMVDWRPDWPTDAMSFKTDSFWRIVIRSSD